LDLIADILSGNKLALAKALTAVENDAPDASSILSALYPNGGKSYLIGVTGSPGTGKSTLVNQLVLRLRKEFPDQKVAILAIDPTSPFSGGAVLGDRIRMQDLSGDPGVFIRSMASRGALGGLATQTAGLAQLFDCAGYSTIFIETVGAGQNEVDIVRLAHTTIVVEAPGLGDDIQAIKAGILEIADILVVNKADRPGVEATERSLKSMLELSNGSIKAYGHHRPASQSEGSTSNAAGNWRPPVLRTIATERQGIDKLLAQILAHKEWLVKSGEWHSRDRARVEAEVMDLFRLSLFNHWKESVSDEQLREAFEQVYQRIVSPQGIVNKLIGNTTTSDSFAIRRK
jgi:LAO/AO transport system kinase